MKKVYNKLFFLLIASVFLTGCMNIDQHVLDDVQLATALGYRYIEDDEIEVTAVFPNFQADKSVKNQAFTATSKLSKEVRGKLSLQSEKPFVSGKIEVALYERKTAEKGIFELLDTLQRDPAVGANVYLAVVEGDPKDFLSKQYGNSDTGLFLSNLIEQNIESGKIPKTNLHIFGNTFYAGGIDPWLPIFDVKNGQIILKQLGLFKGDKIVDQINEEDFFLFKTLLERKSEHDTYALELEEGKKASIYNIDSKRRFDIKDPMTTSEIKITLKMRAIIREFTDGTLDQNKIRELETKMQQEIEQKAEAMIQRFQEQEIDPIGIGEQVRTRTRNWNREKWKELYKDIKISVHVNIHIIESGVIE